MNIFSVEPVVCAVGSATERKKDVSMALIALDVINSFENNVFTPKILSLTPSEEC